MSGQIKTENAQGYGNAVNYTIMQQKQVQKTSQQFRTRNIFGFNMLMPTKYLQIAHSTMTCTLRTKTVTKTHNQGSSACIIGEPGPESLLEKRLHNYQLKFASNLNIKKKSKEEVS